VTDELLTLATEFRHEVERVRGSRFLTTVAPVSTPADAEAFVARIRDEFSDATHNCWAWRVGRAGEVFRSSDDGEPGGSAGRPILQQLEGRRLTNVAAVVTRWFGGTKLGVGGLMRAYGGATGKTLDRAPLRRIVVTRRVEIEHPYECSGALAGLYAARGLEPASSAYGASVTVVLDVPERDLAGFLQEVADRTAGRAETRV